MPQAPRFRLGIEFLEDRTVPAAGADRVLVAFADGADTAAHRQQLRDVPGADAVTALGFGTYRVDLTAGISAAFVAPIFAAGPGVRAAGADARITSTATPNDPQTGSQWGLSTISAPRGWGVETGSGHTVVAVIDTGIDLTHPDLAANIWRNPDASAPDQHGYDFVNNDNDPTDDNGHGTAVAGVIGAVGNNGVGVTGVAWNTKLMALKFMDANGNGFTSDAIRALDYAVQRGAKVVNNSWAGAAADPFLAQAIARARAGGVIVVIAAGNESSNNDTTPAYPANYVLNSDNVVVVAASDENDRLSSYSNYGATTVTLAAPADNTVTTARGGGYTYKSGTSISTPMVSGALALLRDEHPTWDHVQILNKLKMSVDTLPALVGKVGTHGRLNLAKLLDAPAVVPPVSPPPVSPPPAVVSPPVSPPPVVSPPVVSPPVSPPPTSGLRETGSGPRVTSAVFSGAVANGYDRVRVTFDKRISAYTATAAKFALTGPNGKVAITAVTLVAGTLNQFEVTFARQTAAGTYTLAVGPDIWDTFAKNMDQNGNGTNGEAADKYTVSATLGATTSPPAVSPPISPPPVVATRRTVAAAGLPVAIRDQVTTRVFLTVTENVRVADLRLTLDISHAKPTDLYIRLVSPDGRRTVVFNRRNLALSNVTFDDTATRAVATAASLPGGSSAKPEQALSLFAGVSAKGTWTVEIFDLFSGTTGTVRNASLSIKAG